MLDVGVSVLYVLLLSLSCVVSRWGSHLVSLVTLVSVLTRNLAVFCFGVRRGPSGKVHIINLHIFTFIQGNEDHKCA